MSSEKKFEEVIFEVDMEQAKQMEPILKKAGMTMEEAVERFIHDCQKCGGLPYGLKADPLYSKTNMQRVSDAIEQLEQGKGQAHALIEEND